MTPHNFDSDHDYYDYLAKGSGAYEPDEPEEDWREPEDGDCDYWASQCFGRG